MKQFPKHPNCFTLLIDNITVFINQVATSIYWSTKFINRTICSDVKIANDLFGGTVLLKLAYDFVDFKLFTPIVEKHWEVSVGRQHALYKFDFAHIINDVFLFVD